MIAAQNSPLGQVPVGYKQTEVGVIPEDWDVRLLSEHFQIYAGGDVPKHSLSSERSERYPYPIFANALQRKGLYGYTSERRSKEDSLTITGRGFLGHAEYRDEPFFPIVRLLVLEPIGELDALFTTYAVNERVKFAFESTGVPQLTAPQVGRYAIAAPTKAEQEAIAEALSDADALIESLEQLIAKKRQIKQGAMQELLTPPQGSGQAGKKRLPGFSGEWEVTEMGEVLRFQVGFPFASQFFNQDGEGIRLVRNRDLKGNGEITSYSGEFAFSFVVNNGDILVGMDGEFVPCHWNKGQALLNQRIGRIVPKIGLDSVFAYYRLAEPLKEIESSTAGTTVKHLSHRDVEEICIPLPTKSEQTAIANILSEMDAEIAALESKLAKARQLKQGMMQELLTGKTRLM